jgi:hypothetical protein
MTTIALESLPTPRAPALSRAEHAAAHRLLESPPRGHFRPELLTGLPPPAARWLAHAIAPGTPLWRMARLTMHGTLKVGGRWCPFDALQVHSPGRGMLWKARARMNGLPVVGHDLYVDGHGEMRWKLLGLLPVVRADGPDIARSARGRLAAETAAFLPTWLASPDVTWTAEGPDVAIAHLAIDGEPYDLRLEVAGNGALKRVSFARWGQPNPREPFGLYPFGCEVLEERTFAGLTVPGRMRAGWFFGEDRFEREGEFFRAELDSLRPL